MKVMANPILFAKLRVTFICAAILLWSGYLLVAPALVEGAGSISQGFNISDKNAEPGALVTRRPGSQDNLELAIAEHADQLVGVIGEKPLIELSGDNKAHNAQVVISGSTQTFVSDINGQIKTGDKITASPLKGIGMKATEDSQVVGTAQANPTNTTERTITDRDGHKHTVNVALLPVQIDVMYYVADKGRLASLLPSFLQTVADNAAGKSVSPLRVLVGAVILVLGFVTAAIILYSSVRSGITAIGRNPLAHTALLHGLLEVLLTATGVLSITTVAIYVILTT